MIKGQILLLLLILCVPCFGQDAFIWRQTPTSAPILMPQKAGQSQREAIDAYFEKLENTQSLKPLIQNEEIADLSDGTRLRYDYGETTPFDFKSSKKPRFIVVTNELRELYYEPYNRRIKNVVKQLEEAGAEVLVLPVMHDLTLNAPEGKRYRQKIINSFDAMFILGGADIDPYLYGDTATHALAVNRKRDVSELKFTRQFIEAEQGMSFGVCRGHQMCAVSHRKQLVQDIQIERDAPMLHRNGEHLINIDNNSPIFNDFNEQQIMVNSFHHQEVIIPDNDPALRVTATSLDDTPITEAMEFRNGLGSSLQFHPELMDDDIGHKLMRRFVTLAARHKYSDKGCQEILQAMH